MKLILTSDGISSKRIEDELMKPLPDPSRYYTSCIVTTASSRKEKSNGAIVTKGKLTGLGFACCDLIDIEFEDPFLLMMYDAAYLNDGNPFYLLLLK
ncbi:hypothetical protein FE784_23575 [Paenibacillus hemerocallicola]|uniref:Uncharacterized protein n=1 Tax=Paenibacillus hemerocallicola TaxID=1172614 RepID=A0A5C4T6A9_9BACL|nr:hypothetical protein [Paenibacillus hemerocallicola]TNJ63857.1 hypothetical protein FE784_23575 [Paenibacillus hemerocallicola]